MVRNVPGAPPAVVQVCEDSNDNLLHMVAVEQNGRKSVGSVIQTADGMYPATKANMQKLLRGNLVHRYTTTTDNPQQYLRNANAAVKQGTTDNRQVIRRSTKHRVWESVGRSVAVAAVVAAGGLTVVQQVSMFNSFMADGTLDASEIASLGFNALEGLSVPAAIRDVVHAATGDGPFVDDLITADNGVGPVEELVGGWGEGAVDFFRELFSS